LHVEVEDFPFKLIYIKNLSVYNYILFNLWITF